MDLCDLLTASAFGNVVDREVVGFCATDVVFVLDGDACDRRRSRDGDAVG